MLCTACPLDVVLASALARPDEMRRSGGAGWEALWLARVLSNLAVVS